MQYYDEFNEISIILRWKHIIVYSVLCKDKWCTYDEIFCRYYRVSQQILICRQNLDEDKGLNFMS